MRAIKRREFIEKSIAGSMAMPLTVRADKFWQSHSGSEMSGLLNAYYFRAHMYTLVPDQVRYDMDRIASTGAKAVSVAIIEQDLFAAIENVNIIIEEASKRGLKVFAVPSRWGGLLAGAPKVPSLFSIRNQNTWMLDREQNYIDSSVSGRISSIHYPETEDFFKESLSKIFEYWDIKGIIWDEPKNMKVDYSEMAMANLSGSEDLKDHLISVRNFYSRINKYIRSIKQDAVISMFIYANVDELSMQVMSEIENLDFFGCDGRPWYSNDGGQDESMGKCLLDSGLRFLEIAKAKNKGSLWLIENHNLNAGDTELLRKRIGETVNYKPDQLIYYYFPRNLSNPGEIMRIIEENIIEKY